MSKKIQFDIKYRPQIESGEYKVEIGKSDPWPARIACWDLNGNDLIVIVSNPEGKEEGLIYTPEGKHKAYAPRIDSDLFLVTPEPELTEFEKAFDNLAELYHSDENPDDVACCKEYAAELLSLAREQFIKDGYVIEKKAFHDAVENISDKSLAEMSVQYSIHCKVEDGTRHAVMNWEAFQKVAQKFIDIGKAEALKDLPRWEPNQVSYSEEPVLCNGNTILNLGWVHIHINQLKKLPGFNED